MKESPQVALPKEITGKLAGFLFLALIPLVTLVPVTPVPAWLTQDLALRWVSAVVFLFCVSGYIRKPKGSFILSLDFPNLVVLLLAAWVLLSVKNSKEAFESFYAFRSFMALVLWWFSLRIIWRRWPEIYPLFEKVFFWTSVIASVWLCVTTFGHDLRVPSFLNVFPREGLFNNENIAAGFLGMAFLWLGLKRIHRQPAPLWGLGLIFLAWTRTESRGAFIAMSVVILLYLILHMKEIETWMKRWNLKQWLLFAVFVVVFLICSSFTLHKIFESLKVDSRALNRWPLWTSSFKMAMAQPLLGFGPGTFQDVYHSYQPASIWNSFVGASHNEYLQVAVECGWPALLLTLLLLGIVLRETGSRLLKTDSFREVSLNLQAFECVFFLVLLEAIHNLVDFTFHEWCHRLVLLAFLTYPFSRKRLEEDVKTTFHFSRRAFYAGSAVLVLAVFWTLGVGGLRDYLAYLYNFNGSAAIQQNNLELAEVYGHKSLGMRGDFMKPWNLLGAIEQVRGEGAVNLIEKNKHFQLAEQYYEKAIQLSPFSMEPMENRIDFMIAQRRMNEALELQKQLVEKAPENPVVYIRQARILLLLGRAQEAIVAAQKAIDLDDHYVPSYLAKAQAMEALGKKNDAIQVYGTIEEIVRKTNDPVLIERLKEIDSNIQRLKKSK